MDQKLVRRLSKYVILAQTLLRKMAFVERDNRVRMAANRGCYYVSIIRIWDAVQSLLQEFAESAQPLPEMPISYTKYDAPFVLALDPVCVLMQNRPLGVSNHSKRGR